MARRKLSYEFVGAEAEIRSPQRLERGLALVAELLAAPANPAGPSHPALAEPEPPADRP